MIVTNERIERLAALDREALVELIAAAMLVGRGLTTVYYLDPTWRQLVLAARLLNAERDGWRPLFTDTNTAS